MTWDRSKICVIDTENRSASLYTSLGQYKVINFTPPFGPDRYIEAMREAIKAGAEVVVMDSISQEWNGRWWILDIKETMTGNDFAKWAKLTPMHNQFWEAILQAPVHVIVTGRTKEEYSMVTGNDWRIRVEKAGTNIIQRDGVEYELTLAFTIDIKHNATCSKDRTGLFMDKPAICIDEAVGEKLLARCNEWVEAAPTVQIVANDPNSNTFNMLISTLGLTAYQDSCKKAFDEILASPGNAHKYIEMVRSSDKFWDNTDKMVQFIMDTAEYAVSRV